MIELRLRNMVLIGIDYLPISHTKAAAALELMYGGNYLSLIGFVSLVPSERVLRFINLS
jgi:hypothetical protein